MDSLLVGLRVLCLIYVELRKVLYRRTARGTVALERYTRVPDFVGSTWIRREFDDF